jgi:hypothetical protein
VISTPGGTGVWPIAVASQVVLSSGKF